MAGMAMATYQQLFLVFKLAQMNVRSRDKVPAEQKIFKLYVRDKKLLMLKEFCNNKLFRLLFDKNYDFVLSVLHAITF